MGEHSIWLLIFSRFFSTQRSLSPVLINGHSSFWFQSIDQALSSELLNIQIGWVSGKLRMNIQLDIRQDFSSIKDWIDFFSGLFAF